MGRAGVCEGVYWKSIDVRRGCGFDRTVLAFLEPPRDSDLASEGGRLLLPGAVPTGADREAEQAKALVLGSRQVRALTADGCGRRRPATQCHRARLSLTLGSGGRRSGRRTEYGGPGIASS